MVNKMEAREGVLWLKWCECAVTSIRLAPFGTNPNLQFCKCSGMTSSQVQISDRAFLTFLRKTRAFPCSINNACQMPLLLRVVFFASSWYPSRYDHDCTGQTLCANLTLPSLVSFPFVFLLSFFCLSLVWSLCCFCNASEFYASIAFLWCAMYERHSWTRTQLTTCRASHPQRRCR